MRFMMMVIPEGYESAAPDAGDEGVLIVSAADF